MRTITLLFVLLAVTVARANNDNDTVIVKNAKKVTIVTNDSLQKIEIQGKEGDDNFHYTNTIQLVDSNYVSSAVVDRNFGFAIGPSKNNRHPMEVQMHFMIGYNSALSTPEHMDVKPFSSADIMWEIGEFNYRPWSSSTDQIAVGVGLLWRSYRMTGSYRFVKSAEGVTSVQPVPEGAEPKFSRIKTFGLSFPILYKFNRVKRFSFQFGPIINCISHSSMLTRYKLDGKKIKDSATDLHHNPVTVDLIAILSNPIVDMYVKWSPCNAFQSDFAPKFHSLSFGFYF